MPGALVKERNLNMVLGCEELSRAAEQLEGRPPQEILGWAVNVYGEDLTLSVSFGNPEGMVLLDMLSRLSDKVRVFTLDTGFLFHEVVRFREEVMERYPCPVVILRPEFSVEEQVERYGEEMWSCSPDLCCQVRKVEPQKRWLANFRAWMTGIRRNQTSQRASTQVVSFEEHFGVAKIAPLAAWGMDEVDEYVRRYEVPLNPLLSMGYRSIGCEPCTRPVAPGEDARAGRWPEMDKTECGLHFVGGAVKRANP